MVSAMAYESLKRSLQTSLLHLRDDSLGGLLLCQLESRVDEIAQQLVQSDAYEENGALITALQKANSNADLASVQQHIAHRLWCESRTAQWLYDMPMRRLGYQTQDAHWYQETLGHPTILIAPMTIAQPDAMRSLLQHMQGRRIVVYGESIEAQHYEGIEIAGNGLSAVRRIRDVLDNNGVLCTYADFAYAHHPTLQTEIFGCPRAISAGLVSFAQRKGVHLLPLIQSINSDQTQCTSQFFECTILQPDDDVSAIANDEPLARAQRNAAAALLIGQLLEHSISQAPLQWQLLATLAFSMHQ
jgi:hypothetical protein